MEKKEGWFIDSHEGNIKEQYHFIEKLANGGFGIVYLAEHRKTGEKYAIKAIQKKRVKDYMTFKNEINILKVLDHPNIIKLYEIWEWNEVCFLVIEYCAGGELFHYIIERKHLTEPEAALIMKQLFAALKYLHEQNISHRDIKPENFMLHNKGDTSVIKLIDFGLSKDYSGQPVMSTPSGSPYYIAPEVFQQNYTSKIDLWSMGVVMYILLSGKVPFPGRNELEIIGNVIKGEFHFNHDAFKNVSDECKDLICHLLVKDPTQRFSAEEAYNHRWIQKFSQEPEGKSLPADYDEMKDAVEKMRSKKATLTYFASKLPEKNFQSLKESFQVLDKAGTGKVDNHSFARCLSSTNMKTTEREVQTLVEELDSAQEGNINYEEFLNCCFLSYIYLKEYKLRMLFEEADKEKKGGLSVQQIKHILSTEDFQFPEDALDRIFKQELKVDLTQVGPEVLIDYKQFLESLRKVLNVE